MSLSWWAILLIVFGALVAIQLIITLIVLPILVFLNTVPRKPKNKRVRECTNLKDEDQVKMFNEGCEWANKYNDKRHELEITHNGLTLKGEYIDFGSDKCVIILPGRAESLLYSYYFAKPYAESGYNIFVVDLRAHGLSDGKYQTGGVKESEDMLSWIDLLIERYHIKTFLFHGICIGAATAIYTTLELQKRGYPHIEKIVCEGLFASYFEMYKGNFALYKQKPFPVLHLTFFLAKIITGVNFFKNRPLDVIENIECPILLIYSKEDSLCPEESNKKLHKLCKNTASKLVFLPFGRHSHVRSLNTKLYDEEIKQFIV